ncbi:MAG TPA: hypothetical protein V6C97_08700 [Oculatellaceae cyanobacterium]
MSFPNGFRVLETLIAALVVSCVCGNASLVLAQAYYNSGASPGRGPSQQNALTPEQVMLENSIYQATQEVNQYTISQQHALAKEKSLETEISQLEKKTSYPAIKANPGTAQLTLLRKMLAQTKVTEQQDATNINNLDGWIKHWREQSQNISWNNHQDRIDARTQRKQAAASAQNAQLEASTTQGTQHWAQINYVPQSSGVEYDGWTAIPIGCPQ